MAIRIALWLTSCVILSTFARPFLQKSPQNPPPSAGPLIVNTQSGRAVFDVECGGEASPIGWTIVVGSLGDSRQEYSVRLSSNPIAECEIDSYLPLHTDSQDGAVQFGIGRGIGSDVEATGLVVRDRVQYGRLTHSSDEPVPSVISRTFHMHVTDGSLTEPEHYVAVKARCVAAGDRVNVFLDEQVDQGELASGLVEQLTMEFDNGVIAEMERRFGFVNDIDGDGRFAVLLSPWLSRLQGGTVSLKGFVRSSDFRTTHPAPFSNQSDLLYLNSNLRPGADLSTLLAHEFTHAIVSDRRRHEVGEEDDWLNEGLAHVSETRFGNSLTNIGHRIARFHFDSSQCPLVVSDYYDADMWRHHGCRGATWSFVNYLQTHYGDKVIDELIQTKSCGIRSIERVTATRFTKLFRNWSAAVFESNVTQSEVLTNRSGNWLFSRPQTQVWDLKQDLKATVRGTACFGIQVSEPGRHRIKVTADSGAELQVTLIPIHQANHHTETTVEAVVDDDAEFVVSVFGLDVKRIISVCVEDHSASPSRSYRIDLNGMSIDEDVVEKDACELTVRATCTGMLNAEAVKVLYETTRGETVCLHGSVTRRKTRRLAYESDVLLNDREQR